MLSTWGFGNCGTAVKVVLGSDERTVLTEAIFDYLRSHGHDIELIDVAPWSKIGRLVGERVAAGTSRGERVTGVATCYTGTGVSIAANKVRGIRAALCTDAATAAGARRWNDANVLAIGLRLTSIDIAHEMLDAWFATLPEASESSNIAQVEEPA